VIIGDIALGLSVLVFLLYILYLIFIFAIFQITPTTTAAGFVMHLLSALQLLR
jgi:hypothetical protein